MKLTNKLSFSTNEVLWSVSCLVCRVQKQFLLLKNYREQILLDISMLTYVKYIIQSF